MSLASLNLKPEFITSPRSIEIKKFFRRAPKSSVGFCGTRPRRVRTCDRGRGGGKTFPCGFEHVTGGRVVEKLSRPPKVLWAFVGPGGFKHVTRARAMEMHSRPLKVFQPFVGHVTKGRVVGKLSP